MIRDEYGVRSGIQIVAFGRCQGTILLGSARLGLRQSGRLEVVLLDTVMEAS